jgi:DNA-binding transcriptional LysR family regulator
MNLHHLAIFHAIAATGSITGCAKRMHISQPAVSRQLRDFERRLGVELFERLPRGMRLTHAGEVLRDYSTRLFEIALAAEASVQELSDARQGHLAIGASNTIGTYILPSLVARFRRDHPRVRITMFVGNTEQVTQGVSDLRFMLGFIEGPLHGRDLRAQRFLDDEIVPVASGDHPLSKKKRLQPAELAAQPLLMREPGSGTRELVEGCLRQHGILPGDIVELGSTEAIKQAAVHGGGIAWLPIMCMRRELADRELVRLAVKSCEIRRPLSIILRSSGHIAPPARAFLELLAVPDMARDRIGRAAS